MLRLALPLLLCAAAASAQEVSKPVRGGDSIAARTPRTAGGTTGTTTGATATTVGTAGASTGALPVAKTPVADPVRGRYRVTLNGFTVLRQTYDNPLQTDGKGDEVYFAAWAALVDTAAPQLVEHYVVRSREMGDANGYPNRVRMGQLSGNGGIGTGYGYPQPTPTVRAGSPAKDRLPMVLWEGELVQGRSALLLSPTVWEWDGNRELYGYWTVSRGVVIDRLTTPDALLSILGNRNWFPQELGSPGFRVRTNMFADPRDRPIGLELGRPGTSVVFVEPSGQAGGAAVDAILSAAESARQVLDRWRAILGQVTGGAQATSLADAVLQKIPLPYDGAAAQRRREALRVRVETLRQQANGGLLRTVPLPGLVNAVRAVVRDYTASDVYLIEKTLVLTPAAIEDALRGASTAGGRPRGSVDVAYADHGPLQGRYVLHLQLERLR